MCFTQPKQPTADMLNPSMLAVNTSGLRMSPSIPLMRSTRVKKTRASYNVISDEESSIYSHHFKKAVPDSALSSLDADGRVHVSHDYHDHADESDPDESYSPPEYDTDEESHSSECHETKGHKRRGPRGGVTVPFPEKLHMMLTNVEKDGYEHVISWQPHGRCFLVHDPKAFVSDVMPRYFRQTKLTSFQRQLNLYGFSRLTSGKDRGAYYHELFLRDRKFLCKRMMRTRIKGTGIKAASSPSTEPDFYKMPFIKGPPQKAIKKEEEPVEKAFEPPSFFPRKNKPLVMPVLPQSSLDPAKTPPPDEIISAAAMVTPPQTPQQEDVIPPEVPSDWLLTVSAYIAAEDDGIAFEGKTFHYLDTTSFDCLDDVKDPMAWASIKETDDLFADW